MPYPALPSSTGLHRVPTVRAVRGQVASEEALAVEDLLTAAARVAVRARLQVVLQVRCCGGAVTALIAAVVPASSYNAT